MTVGCLARSHRSKPSTPRDRRRGRSAHDGTAWSRPAETPLRHGRWRAPRHGRIKLLISLVGAAGFEPATPVPQTGALTRLRYTPTCRLFCTRARAGSTGNMEANVRITRPNPAPQRLRAHSPLAAAASVRPPGLCRLRFAEISRAALAILASLALRAQSAANGRV